MVLDPKLGRTCYALGARVSDHTVLARIHPQGCSHGVLWGVAPSSIYLALDARYPDVGLRRGSPLRREVVTGPAGLVAYLVSDLAAQGT